MPARPGRHRESKLTTCPLNWQGTGSSLPLKANRNDSENSPRISDSNSIVTVMLRFEVPESTAGQHGCKNPREGATRQVKAPMRIPDETVRRAGASPPRKRYCRFPKQQQDGARLHSKDTSTCGDDAGEEK